MTDDEIFAVIGIVVLQETGEASLEITPEMTANDIPGWDSLAHIRIILELGSRLGVSIDVEATYRAATIGDLDSAHPPLAQGLSGTTLPLPAGALRGRFTQEHQPGLPGHLDVSGPPGAIAPIVDL